MHVQALMMSAIPASAPPPSLVAHTAAASTGVPDFNSITSSAINTTGATFIFISLAVYGPTATSGSMMQDSKGNTYTQLTRYGSGTRNDIVAFVCYSPTVGSGHTFTLDTNPNGNYGSMEVLAFSGITTSAVNATSGSSRVTSTFTVQPGSITPSVANTLVITGLSQDFNTGTITIDSGYTITDNIGPGSTFGSTAAYKVLTSASAQNPTWTSSTLSDALQAAIYAFAY